MRRYDLDQSRAIAILLILIGHSDGIPPLVDRIIYSFHVPLFFILSGILLCYKRIENRSWYQIIHSRIHRLIIPSFFWECILSIFYYFIKGIPATQLIQNTLQLSFNLSVLWFVRCLLIAEFFCILLLKTSHHLPVLLLGMGASVLLAECIDLFYIQQAFTAAFYLLFGYCFEKYRHHIPKAPWVLASLFLVWFLSARMNSRVDLCAFILGNTALYYLHSTAGSLCIILFFLLLNKPIPLLNWFGQNSIGFLVTHVFVRFAIVQADHVLLGQDITSWALAFLLIILDSVVVWLIGRFFPEAFGQLRKTQV